MRKTSHNYWITGSYSLSSLSTCCLIILYFTSKKQTSYSTTFQSQLTTAKLAPGHLHKCSLVLLLLLSKCIVEVAKQDQ